MGCLYADMEQSPKKFLLIAGPCALESVDICRQIAEVLVDLKKQYPFLDVYFKGSFDKANRTSVKSPRGLGLEKGLACLKTIGDQFHLPTITDVHETHQVQPVSEVCDVIQIPAFLCRQTDLILAAGRTGKIVSVKKGQFLPPSQMRFIVQKLQEVGAVGIWQIERGFCLGYENLVVDMRNFSLLQAFSRPVIFDATHSTQAPGGNDTTSGNWKNALPLAKAAVAAGADGLFVETHPSPSEAVSDKEVQIPLEHIGAFIEACVKIYQSR